MNIQQAWSTFLRCTPLEGKRVLLACSGGADSTALFHLLLQSGIAFEVAHVDHAWPEEAIQEARAIEQLCQRHAIPFHFTRLELPESENNLEDRWRNGRNHFFQKVLQERELEGVVMGHHADDQAETILKRLFEGGGLSTLKGLTPIALHPGLKIYRPLLSVQKREILRWLQEKKLPYFIDAIDQNTKFLRIRMRREIIPALAATFGKEISQNLCRLGQRMEELDTFLDSLAAPYLERIEREPERLSIDFSAPLAPFLWKWIIRRLFQQAGIPVSHTHIDSLVFHLQRGSCHRKRIQVRKQRVIVHRTRLTICLNKSGL